MPEARISGTEDIQKDPNDVRVFINYSHEDFGIAQCLQDELTAASWTPLAFVRVKSGTRK